MNLHSTFHLPCKLGLYAPTCHNRKDFCAPRINGFVTNLMYVEDTLELPSNHESMRIQIRPSILSEFRLHFPFRSFKVKCLNYHNPVLKRLQAGSLTFHLDPKSSLNRKPTRLEFLAFALPSRHLIQPDTPNFWHPQ